MQGPGAAERSLRRSPWEEQKPDCEGLPCRPRSLAFSWGGEQGPGV